MLRLFAVCQKLVFDRLAEVTKVDKTSNSTPKWERGERRRGGRSDLSEWQRSVSDAGMHAKERTGYRNRNVDTREGRVAQ